MTAARLVQNFRGVRALLALVERFGIVNINRSVFDEAPGFAEAVARLWPDAGEIRQVRWPLLLRIGYSA